MEKKMKHTKRSLLALACLLAVSVASAQSPYIHRVYDYRPAPGQFVNELLEYKRGDTQADMIRKVEEYIAGEHHNEGMVSLGGYGGYLAVNTASPGPYATTASPITAPDERFCKKT
jgi:hypothetical protein